MSFRAMKSLSTINHTEISQIEMTLIFFAICYSQFPISTSFALEEIHIISMRKATKHEQKLYFKALSD